MLSGLKGNAPFGGIRDIRSSLHRASIGGMLNPTELLEISTTMFGTRRLKRFVLAAHEEYAIPMLKTQVDLLTENKPLEDKINSCIDENAVVVDGASPELGRVRSELRTGEGRVRERLEQMIRTSSVQKMLQDVLITIRNDRFVIPVKSEYRSSFGGIIHDQSASGATLYIEPDAIVQLNNKIRELKFKEEAEIEKILRALTELVAEQVEVLVLDVDQLAELDFMFAKAGLAREMKATMPRLNDRGFIKIKRGRHPLIARDAVVPLDLEIGQSIIHKLS